MKISDELIITAEEFEPSRHMALLLQGDESEVMIERYISGCELFTGCIGGTLVAVCAVAREGENVIEIKNLAVSALWRRHGIGRRMLRYAESLFPGQTVMLGTGEAPSTLRFYESCGYDYSHRVKDFFTRNYPEPIIEEGVRLRDMVYFRKECRKD